MSPGMTSATCRGQLSSHMDSRGALYSLWLSLIASLPAHYLHDADITSLNSSYRVSTGLRQPDLPAHLSF